jgi:hypothetical protein
MTIPDMIAEVPSIGCRLLDELFQKAMLLGFVEKVIQKHRQNKNGRK